MSIKTKALKAAFPHTIPVFAGIFFLGMSYGMLMNSKGYGVGWTALTSLLVFAGSAQYATLGFLTGVFNPLPALLLTLIINARHIFYGISLLDKYSTTGKFKPYLIFGLIDETFAIVSSRNPPEGVDQTWFIFFITLLNHGYWVFGSILGSLLGSMVSFNTKGLDFVLTALFVVIFIGQWRKQKQHAPALIGVVCSVVCLGIFGPGNFIIPAMIAILAVLTIFRSKLTEEETV